VSAIKDEHRAKIVRRQHRAPESDVHRNVKDLAAEGFPSRDDQVE
jgi:hypothetical protein